MSELIENTHHITDDEYIAIHPNAIVDKDMALEVAEGTKEKEVEIVNRVNHILMRVKDPNSNQEAIPTLLRDAQSVRHDAEKQAAAIIDVYNQGRVLKSGIDIAPGN
jgi:hypothetical protein